MPPRARGGRAAARWAGPRYYAREQCGERVAGYEPKPFFAGCEARGDVGPALNASRILAEVRPPRVPAVGGAKGWGSSDIAWRQPPGPWEAPAQ